MAIISFHQADVTGSLSNRNKLKQFILSIFTFNSKKIASLDYIFCSDDYLLEINRQYLHHDFYTDIITFDLSEKDGGVAGEIYISLERVKENASVHKVSFQHELHRVMFHGALHLCGFKDKTKQEKLGMRTAEDFWLANYFP